MGEPSVFGGAADSAGGVGACAATDSSTKWGLRFTGSETGWYESKDVCEPVLAFGAAGGVLAGALGAEGALAAAGALGAEEADGAGMDDSNFGASATGAVGVTGAAGDTGWGGGAFRRAWLTASETGGGEGTSTVCG